MHRSLEDILTDRLRKKELIFFLDKHPELFEQAVKISLGDVQPLAWRAAWLIGNYMETNDARLLPHVDSILSKIPGKGDGHQRELLKILNRLKLSHDQEGILFDICLTIWEEIHKSPSVRGTAFQTILLIVKKYPELKSEIEHLTQPHYTDTLSPGIKNSFFRMVESETE
ncbi:hypothetical protein ACFLTH_02235 [Bacteroidota bacterium]